jgi:hypothetical protein
MGTDVEHGDGLMAEIARINDKPWNHGPYTLKDVEECLNLMLGIAPAAESRGSLLLKKDSGSNVTKKKSENRSLVERMQPFEDAMNVLFYQDQMHTLSILKAIQRFSVSLYAKRQKPSLVGTELRRIRLERRLISAELPVYRVLRGTTHSFTTKY